MEKRQRNMKGENISENTSTQLNASNK